MFLIKFIGYLLLSIIALILLAFMFCVVKAFFMCNFTKKKPYNYKKIDVRGKK